MKEHFPTIVETCFTQMSAKKGIRTYGERAVAAMLKEYKQLHDMAVFGPQPHNSLTNQEKSRALRAVNLITKKRCGKIKGRTCANGRSQRNYITKEESSSPTISLELLFTTLVIDAHEKRAVQTFDIPGAYLQSPLPEGKTIFMKFEGKFADIMCDINPEYKDTMFVENGKNTLYVKVLKAIYGLIESALIWYDIFSKVLLNMGFELNNTDKCVTNKIINGK
jgi:hypothetical protein